jgi:hypothetical protein
MYRAAHATSAQPEEDFSIPSWSGLWTKTNDPSYVKEFSAVCLLFAKYLAEKLKNKANILSNTHLMELDF